MIKVPIKLITKYEKENGTKSLKKEKYPKSVHKMQMQRRYHYCLGNNRNVLELTQLSMK